jgi:hypothetical protein
VLLFSGSLFFTTATAATVDGVEVPIHKVSSKECKECHKEIYKQWKGSMHAQSTALSDPIHGAFYRQVVGDPTAEGVKAKGKYPGCLKCHAPNAARDGSTKLDADPAYEEGVNCVACHTFGEYHGIGAVGGGKPRLGIDAWEKSDYLLGANGVIHQQGSAADELRARFEEEAEFNPHMGRDNDGNPYMTADDVKKLDLPMQRNSRLKSSEACLGCHDKRNNAQGVSLCQTGDEYLEGKSKETCQSCHMPVSNGLVDHSMGGGHDVAMLKRAVRLDLKARKDGANLLIEAEMENLQPHNVPTGAPFRNAFLKVTALDRDGKVLWQSFKKSVAKEDPMAFLVYTLTDDENHPAPPPKATRPGINTRLKPFETRLLGYKISADGVDSVRAELFYNLLWPGLVEKMKTLPEELKAPKLMAWAEVKL